MQDDYEIGYGKPPKSTQFQKGISGNPRGRPKKSRDFHDQLLRESKSLMIINENGQRKRISKHEVVIKQLMKQAMTGSTQAVRIYLTHHQQALERIALSAPQQASDSRKYLSEMTDEELLRLAAGQEKRYKTVVKDLTNKE